MASSDIAGAETLSSKLYIDPSVAAAESERIFRKTWRLAGRADELAENGRYVTLDVAGEPVLVLRGNDGSLRAMSNVCRHRASLLVEGNGKLASLTCQYHGWTYDSEGKLLAAPEFKDVRDWDPAKVCLPRYRAETLGPLVFVNLDPAAPALGEVLGGIPEEIAAQGWDLDDFRFVYRRNYVVKCNWKAYVDNYLEGYHIPSVHPALFKMLDYSKYRVRASRYYSSQDAPLRGAGAGGSAASGGALYYWVFPGFMLNIYPDNMSTNLVIPLGVDRTLTVFDWYLGKHAPAYRQLQDQGLLSGIVEDQRELPPELERIVSFSHQVQLEDTRVCEAVQRGLSSRTYDRGRYSPRRENGVFHFHQLVREFLGEG